MWPGPVRRLHQYGPGGLWARLAKALCADVEHLCIQGMGPRDAQAVSAWRADAVTHAPRPPPLSGRRHSAPPADYRRPPTTQNRRATEHKRGALERGTEACALRRHLSRLAATGEGGSVGRVKRMCSEYPASVLGSGQIALLCQALCKAPLHTTSRCRAHYLPVIPSSLARSFAQTAAGHHYYHARHTVRQDAQESRVGVKWS